MNFKCILNKAKYLSALTALPLTVFSGCGPQSQGFSILPAKEAAFQGSVANNKVDLLFVIDNSGSMLTKQDNLANGFGSFVDVFAQKGFDYHIAVVTTDTRSSANSGQDGDFQGSPLIITNALTGSALSTAFTNNVKVGDQGDQYSKPLDAVVLSLSSAKLAGHNANFLRSDAHLAIINLTDADDNDSTNSTSDVLSFLQALKPERFDVIARTYKKNFTISAVVAQSLTDPDCSSMYHNGIPFFEVGDKLISLANSTSGSVASICKPDFSAGLSQISQRIAEAITEIPLSSVPEVSTIKITFNGSAVPKDASNGWSYASSGNKIVFHGSAIPSDNTSIGIDYTPNDIIR
jgi:hypothetical protein